MTRKISPLKELLRLAGSQKEVAQTAGIKPLLLNQIANGYVKHPKAGQAQAILTTLNQLCGYLPDQEEYLKLEDVVEFGALRDEETARITTIAERRNLSKRLKRQKEREAGLRRGRGRPGKNKTRPDNSKQPHQELSPVEQFFQMFLTQSEDVLAEDTATKLVTSNLFLDTPTVAIPASPALEMDRPTQKQGRSRGQLNRTAQLLREAALVGTVDTSDRSKKTQEEFDLQLQPLTRIDENTTATRHAEVVSLVFDNTNHTVRVKPSKGVLSSSSPQPTEKSEQQRRRQAHHLSIAATQTVEAGGGEVNSRTELVLNQTECEQLTLLLLQRLVMWRQEAARNFTGKE